MSLFLTAAQTVGPFGAISFEGTQVREVAPTGVSGERVAIRGRVLDGDGKPVDDALVETFSTSGQREEPRLRPVTDAVHIHACATPRSFPTLGV